LRALLCCINYAPELTGIGKYTREMAEWLADRGIDVTVVTAPPYYPAWRVEEPYSASRYSRETLRGVRVIRCPLWIPRRATGLKRIVHLASFALSSLPVLLWLAVRQRPRLVLVVEPPLFAAPAAKLAARLAGATAWLHVQDFEVDAAFNLGVLRLGALRRFALAAEGWLMRGFDRVSTISEKMVAHLAAKSVTADRTRLFPNWVELDRIRPLTYTPRLREEHFAADRIVVLYSGNMGAKHELETLIEAAKLLEGAADERIHLLLCGDGVGKEALQQRAKDARNITFWPLVPVERLNELLNLADIHVLPQRGDAEDLVFPSKLTNMLASGRPVVATAKAKTQIADVLADAGVVVPPGDPAALADALRSLAADPERRRALGAHARRTAEQLWDKNAVLAKAFRDHFGPLADVVPQLRPVPAADAGPAVHEPAPALATTPPAPIGLLRRRRKAARRANAVS
jgi:colanic acid biosynthesis glycosyl transferase WcaI